MTQPKLPTGWWLWSVRASEMRPDTLGISLLRGGTERFRFNRIDVATVTLVRCLNRFAKPVCRNVPRMIHSREAVDQTGSWPTAGSWPEEAAWSSKSRDGSTIADVAEAAGVSKTAVSFAFNNPGRLNVDTASRIMEIADSLGYRPDPVARMLTQRRTGTIGLLTPQALASIFSNPFFGMFSAGVAAVAEEAGYGLHFISPLHGSLSRAIARATVDGVVAIGLAADHPEIAEIRRAGLPMTTVDSDPFDKSPRSTSTTRAGRGPRRST